MSILLEYFYSYWSIAKLSQLHLCLTTNTMYSQLEQNQQRQQSHKGYC